MTDRQTKTAVDRFHNQHTPYGAYVVVVLDAQTGIVRRAGIHSSPSSGLTQDLKGEILLDGPSAGGVSYQDALDKLRKVLAGQPNWAWLRGRLTGFRPDPR